LLIVVLKYCAGTSLTAVLTDLHIYETCSKQSCDTPLQRAWHVFRNTQSWLRNTPIVGHCSVSKHQILGCLTPFTGVTKCYQTLNPTPPGDNVRMRNTQIECSDPPKVVAAGFPPDLGCWNTGFLQCTPWVTPWNFGQNGGGLLKKWISAYKSCNISETQQGRTKVTSATIDN